MFRFQILEIGEDSRGVGSEDWARDRHMQVAAAMAGETLSNDSKPTIPVYFASARAR